jgi:hypothetical protein
MSAIKDEEQKDISTEYATKFFHEDSRMSGFLQGKIIRIRNIMKAWKAESAKQDKDNSEEQDVNR